MKIIDILNQVGSTSKGSEKEAILAKHKDNKILQQVFFYTYSTFQTYGIKKLPLERISGSKSIDVPSDFKLVLNVLDRLVKRELTGGDASEAVLRLIEAFDEGSQEVIKRIIDRDLKVGATDTIMNRLVPNLVPTFDVALAKTYDESTMKNVTFGTNDWYISRKLDGIRCMVIVQGSNAVAYSRQGKVFETIDKVKNDLITLCKDITYPVVFDGELCIVDKDGNENFTEIIKEYKKKDHQIDKPLYQIFDFMTQDEFFEKTPSPVFSKRISNLKDLFVNSKYSHLKVLEQLPLTEESFDKMADDVAKFGYEGSMIRKNCRYESGRTKNLLKIKKFMDAEYVVEDIELGELNFAEKDIGTQTITCVRALKIRHKGNIVSVGSGLTKSDRIDFMNNPKKIIGKTVCIKYFQESADTNGKLSLRFPTLKAIYGDKREV